MEGKDGKPYAEIIFVFLLIFIYILILIYDKEHGRDSISPEARKFFLIYLFIFILLSIAMCYYVTDYAVKT